MKRRGPGHDVGFVGSYSVLSLDVSQSIGWHDLSLKTDDVIGLRTMNTQYVMRVIDPERYLVEVTSNGRAVPGPQRLIFRGTLLSSLGTTLIPGRFVLGLGVELALTPEDQRLRLEAGSLPRVYMLSSSQELTLNGIPVLPRGDVLN